MDSPSTENAGKHHQHIQPGRVNKLMLPEHRVKYKHQMQQQDTKILTTRSCYQDQLITETSGMEQNKLEGQPGLQHVMGTSQSLHQSVGCLLRMA